MTSFAGFDEAVVVDVETTGLDPEKDRVISVALVRARFVDLKRDPNGLKGETMDTVVNPQCKIPLETSRIHGITDRDVADKGPFVEVAQRLRDFIGDRPIIAHNASFDKKFLTAEFKRAGLKSLARNKSFCTMRRFQDFNHGRRKGSDLDSVAETTGVKGRTSRQHDATEDARMTFEIAALFYMMDNRIQIPGGKPNPPSRTRRNGYHNSGESNLKGNELSFVSALLGLLVVGLLIWLAL